MTPQAKLARKRTSDEVIEAVRAAMAHAADHSVGAALERYNLKDSVYYKYRKLILAGRTNGASANGHAGKSTDFLKRRQTAATQVAKVQQLVAGGARSKDAIKAAGFKHASMYYFWKRSLDRQAQDSAAVGAPLPRNRAPVATVDNKGRKLVPASLIFEGMEVLRMTIPELEGRIGCEPGIIDRYMRAGMCPNEFALAIAALMADEKSTKNGLGGYTAKKDQKVVLVRIPRGHSGMLGTMVEHLGGEVMHRED